MPSLQAESLGSQLPIQVKADPDDYHSGDVGGGGGGPGGGLTEICRINEFGEETADFARYAEPTIATFYSRLHLRESA